MMSSDELDFFMPKKIDLFTPVHEVHAEIDDMARQAMWGTHLEPADDHASRAHELRNQTAAGIANCGSDIESPQIDRLLELTGHIRVGRRVVIDRVSQIWQEDGVDLRKIPHEETAYHLVLQGISYGFDHVRQQFPDVLRRTAGMTQRG